jgi:hypothetical protein
MPFINVALDDAKEAEAVPEGEYDLRIVKSEDGESKKGNAMTTVYIKIEDNSYPNAALLRHWITYPDRDTPADQRQMRLLDIKRFLTCFGVAMEGNGFNSDDLIGATGRSFLYQEEGDDGNIYNRLRLPRLKA